MSASQAEYEGSTPFIRSKTMSTTIIGTLLSTYI